MTTDSYLIRDAIVEAADKLNTIYPTREVGEERFRSELQVLREAICPSNIPSIGDVDQLFVFLREDREKNFPEPIEESVRESFLVTGEILVFMIKSVNNMYRFLSQCSLQIIFAHFRCPRGFILFSPFMEKSGKPKTPERVRTTLSVALLGAVYISMYYCHILEWNQLPGEELSFLLEDSKDGHNLERFRQLAEEDIKAVSSREFFFFVSITLSYFIVIIRRLVPN